MKIAMYAPLKPPDHPAASGDRQMARLLMAAMRNAGHEVDLVSRLRSYAPSPLPALLADMKVKAAEEEERIRECWRSNGTPDLWFTYHPYYKAPDLVGPPLCAGFAIPYVTAEASYSARRDRDEWATYQAEVTAALRRARLNICFTQRDRDGLSHIVAARRLALVPPFIDAAPFAREPARTRHDQREPRLIAVAMLRRGNKSKSFRMLAAALDLIGDLDWQLTIVGGGPAGDEVKAMFKGLAAQTRCICRRDDARKHSRATLWRRPLRLAWMRRGLRSCLSGSPGGGFAGRGAGDGGRSGSRTLRDHGYPDA